MNLRRLIPLCYSFISIHAIVEMWASFMVKSWVFQSWIQPERTFSTSTQYRSLTTYIYKASFSSCFYLQNWIWGRRRRCYFYFTWVLNDSRDCRLVSESTKVSCLPGQFSCYSCIIHVGPRRVHLWPSTERPDFNQSTWLSSGFVSELSNLCEFNIPSSKEKYHKF